MSTMPTAIPVEPAPQPQVAPLPPGVPQPTDNPDISFDDVFGSGEPTAEPQPPPVPAPPAPYMGQFPSEQAARDAFAAMQSQLQFYQTQDAIRQQVAMQAAPPPPPMPAAPPISLQQQQFLASALEDTIKGTRPTAFQEAVGQMVQPLIRQEAEAMLRSALSPLVPIIQYANVNRGLEMAAKAAGWGDPNIPAFRHGENFATALRQYPGLANAIQVAESNPNYAWQLPELYGLAYKVGQTVAPVAAPPARPPATATPALRPAAQALGGGGTVLDTPLDEVFRVPLSHRF